MEEKREIELLNFAAARMESGEMERAEMMPLVEVGSSFLVEMEVYGWPGFEIENIEISDSVPHIRLR